MKLRVHFFTSRRVILGISLSVTFSVLVGCFSTFIYFFCVDRPKFLDKFSPAISLRFAGLTSEFELRGR